MFALISTPNLIPNNDKFILRVEYINSSRPRPLFPSGSTSPREDKSHEVIREIELLNKRTWDQRNIPAELFRDENDIKYESKIISLIFLSKIKKRSNSTQRSR